MKVFINFDDMQQNFPFEHYAAQLADDPDDFIKLELLLSDILSRRDEDAFNLIAEQLVSWRYGSSFYLCEMSNPIAEHCKTLQQLKLFLFTLLSHIYRKLVETQSKPQPAKVVDESVEISDDKKFHLAVMIPNGCVEPPEEIIAQRYGGEIITPNAGVSVIGQSILLLAPAKIYAKFFNEHYSDGIWTSTSPQLGNWEFVTPKPTEQVV